jgi:hypothetical protein
MGGKTKKELWTFCVLYATRTNENETATCLELIGLRVSGDN